MRKCNITHSSSVFVFFAAGLWKLFKNKRFIRVFIKTGTSGIAMHQLVSHCDSRTCKSVTFFPLSNSNIVHFKCLTSSDQEGKFITA
jgi:hypothetical protein